MRKRRIIERTAAATAAAAIAAMSSIPAYAQKKTLSAADIIDAIHKEDLVSDALCRKLPVTVDFPRQPVVDASGLPSEFDLRDVDGKNYVSPVKDQSPWGTCWSFGATSRVVREDCSAL